MTEERLIETSIHGSYLAEGPPKSLNCLVGFHGYGETPSIMMERLRQVAPGPDWRLCAVRSLHLFYSSRSREVVGSWMTRQHRELAIQDNISYINKILDDLEAEAGRPRNLVLAGFSQGAAMAYRAAQFCKSPSCALLILAGDVPPDVASANPCRLPPVLLGRGSQDPLYSTEVFTQDQEVIRGKGILLETSVFEGGHSWETVFSQACTDFLNREH